MAFHGEGREAREVAATLAQAMTRTNDPKAIQTLITCLSVVSIRLEAKEASPWYAVAAAALTQALTGVYQVIQNFVHLP